MIGKTISRYRIVEKLGGGGMGVVYKAEDTTLGRHVALKFLPEQLSQDKQALERFKREARAAAALNHPNICTIHEIGEHEGQPFIVMELLEGETLRHRIRGQPLKTDEVLELGTQISSGLEAAHRKEIVHRDIKPANIFVTEDGQAKILDFGLAKLTQPGRGSGTTIDGDAGTTEDEHLTSPGVSIGTVVYMSPEQVRGEELDARSDLFSFGLVLYEMATGRQAFTGSTPGVIFEATLNRAPTPAVRLNPDIPPKLEEVINKAIEKDTNLRYQSANELMADLKRLRRDTDSERVAAVGKDFAPKPTPLRRRRSTLIAAGVFAGVVALAAAALLIYQRVRPTATPVQRPLTQLTFEPGWQGAPSWSPDGRFIAYSADYNGNFDIWVKPAGEGKAVQVTTNPAHDWEADWSPDGSQLVFRSERGEGGLFVVPALGGRERKVSSFGYYPRWSPDGSRILFSGAPYLGMSEPRKVYTVALDGIPPREILGDFLTHFTRAAPIAWHPDGQRVSVMGFHRGISERGFWTVPVNGGEPMRSKLTPEVEERIRAAGVSWILFSWAPSGLAIHSVGVSRGVANLWRITVDPETLEWVGGPERLTTGAGPDVGTAISRDGRKLAFTTRNQAVRIWSVPFDAVTGQTKGEGQPVTPLGMVALSADLTPDGKNLVFFAGHAGKPELWEKSLEEGSDTLLFADDFGRAGARWSRDGAFLAYTRRIDPNKPERAIFLLPAGGGNETMLASPGEAEETLTVTDWSPDGKWVIGSSDLGTPGRPGIWVFPVDAAPKAETRAREVTSNPEYNLWQPHFSPDGRWISFNAVKATDARASTIYVVPSTGGEWTHITEGKYWDDKGRWSPDGRTIYFISSRTGFLNVWGMRFDPVEGKPLGDPFRVTSFESPARFILPDVQVMEISVAANRLILPILEISGNLWMLETVDQ